MRGWCALAKAAKERIELFCQEIIKGATQRQAYYIAYPSSKNWIEKAADSKACTFYNSDRVQERLKELQEEARRKNAISRDDILKNLKSIGFANVDTENIKPSDKIKALEVIAKILGYDKPIDGAELEDLQAIEKELFTDG